MNASTHYRHLVGARHASPSSRANLGEACLAPTHIGHAQDVVLLVGTQFIAPSACAPAEGRNELRPYARSVRRHLPGGLQ